VSEAPKILVVDDHPTNILLLKRILEKAAMEVFTAENGMQCLEQVQKVSPDIILLDIMMPGMDGTEVCERLKKDDDTKSIPVIFITAKDSKEGKLEGLNVGAVDYITKPIDIDETLARVRTQLRFLSAHKENLELHRRLEESRRAAAIGTITQGISHNLNNLLGIVVGYMDLIKAHSSNPKVLNTYLLKLDSAIDRIVSIIQQVGSLSGGSQPELRSVHLSDILESAIQRFQESHGIAASIQIENEVGNLSIETNTEIFEEALSKLLINAWESYGEDGSVDTPIVFRITRADNETLVFSVEDCGSGIPPELKENVFQPFVSSKRTVGVGMGLTIAKQLAKQLGGDLSLQDNPKGGTIATFQLPLSP
jgi:CheY-like chemotaxis protein/two-component sensor histidine kinase